MFPISFTVFHRFTSNEMWNATGTLVRHARRVSKILDISWHHLPGRHGMTWACRSHSTSMLLRGSPTASAWTVTMMGFLYLQSHMSFGVEIRWDKWSQLGDFTLSETTWNPSKHLRNLWKACPSAITFGQSAPCLKNITTLTSRR